MTENAHSTVAFKEWGVICAALAAGRQTLILRKGGIHEGRAGFRVAHRAFWLLPTQFHATAEQLAPDAAPFLAQAAGEQTPGKFRLQHHATVEEVHELASLEQALALGGLHLWSEQTVRERFHYRQPGLFLLIVRVRSAAQPIWIDDSPRIAGCRSWVELDTPLATDGLTPALDDAAFAAARDEIRARLMI